MILEEIHGKTLSGILSESIPDREVYLVGSRAKGTAGRFSDIDLLIAGNTPLSPEERTRLRMALEEIRPTRSNRPHRRVLAIIGPEGNVFEKWSAVAVSISATS